MIYWIKILSIFQILDSISVGTYISTLIKMFGFIEIVIYVKTLKLLINSCFY